MNFPPIMLVLVALALASCAGGRAGEISTVTYRTGEPTLTGYLCKPPGSGPFRAVL